MTAPLFSRLRTHAADGGIETDALSLSVTDGQYRLALAGEQHEALDEDELRTVLNEYPGVAYAFTQPIEMRVSEMLTGVRGDVAVKLFGPDLSVLNEKSAAIVTNTLELAQDEGEA